MITHYDMTTGEIIQEPSGDAPVAPAVQADASPALRLVTVAEAAAMQRQTIRLPADMAMLPVHALIFRD